MSVSNLPCLNLISRLSPEGTLISGAREGATLIIRVERFPGKVVLLFIQDAEVAGCEPESWEAARALGAFMQAKPLPTTWAARLVMRRWSVDILLAERKLSKALAADSEDYQRRLERPRRNETARADYTTSASTGWWRPP